MDNYTEEDIKKAFLDGWEEGLSYSVGILESAVEKCFGDDSKHFVKEYMGRIKALKQKRLNSGKVKN